MRAPSVLRYRRAPVAVAVLLLLGVALGSCASGSEDAAESTAVRPIDVGEGRRLAETLFANYESGGASFELSGEMPDGSFVQMTGDVDWVNHTGRAVVDISATADTAVVEVLWGENVVLERIPALTERLDTDAAPRWFSRNPEPEGRHLDSMIELITALASEQRGNPALIAQAEGTAFLRRDVVPGVDVDVDVLRFGQASIYWLAVDGVTMYRFQGNNSAGTRPVLVDLRDHGPRTTPLPLETDVLARADVADLYDEVTDSVAG